MTIRGTLETFNLCELLQMLAFNQKVGTLVLEAEGTRRTIALDAGQASLTAGDPFVEQSLLRLARRHGVADEALLERAVLRRQETDESLLQTMVDLRLIDQDTAQLWHRDVVTELLFDTQLTAVSAFEFVEGRFVRPDGEDGHAIQSLLPVDSLLLDVARMLDHWNAASEIVPSGYEVFEGTGIAVDVTADDDVDVELAKTIVPLIDGYRSLEQIAELSHSSIYAVTLIASALFQNGGIRAVSTEDLTSRAEDLLSRGEAAGALPLLRRSIERGDAPTEARLRLADALEASGEPAAAAAELDTFAALHDDEDAPAVFEALARALELRKGDRATAMRVCDFYLRRRPWLREYRPQALQALRDLVGAATTEQRPLDAAHRLAGFVQAGDAPREDLILLADLCAAGGEHAEAAAALVQRAEDLLEAGRTVQAKDLLRQALEHDPGQADARRRMLDMQGVSRRRLHRTRMALLALLTLVVIAGAGAAWTFYRQSATREVGGARELAEAAVADAERRAGALIEAFKQRVARARQAAEVDAGLRVAAEAMRTQVRVVMDKTQRPLAAFAEEIDTYSASGQQESERLLLRSLEQRRLYMNTQAAALVGELATESSEALAEGRRRHTEGVFVDARRLLRLARNLSFPGTETRARAAQFLAHVDSYFATFEAYRRRMTKATAAGDLKGAFAIGVQALGELMDSDLSRTLPFPVHVQSEPEGAEVWLGEHDTGQCTPCVITYSPFAAALRLTLRLPRRTYAGTDLPSYTQIREGPGSLEEWEPHFEATLPIGPLWRCTDPGGGFDATWLSDGAIVAVGGGGRSLYSVAHLDGAARLTGHLEVGQDPIRMGGSFGTAGSWQVRGQRTLVIQPHGGTAWEMLAIGRIDYAPVRVDGMIILVDELGNVYGLDAKTGAELWKLELGGTPSQAPLASALGVLLATLDGSAQRLAPRKGKLHVLAPPVGGLALAVPFGDRALVLGGGKGGLRLVDAAGAVEVLGDAAPLVERRPCVRPDGVGWLEADGARWIGVEHRRLVRVDGLGSNPLTLSAGDKLLISCSSDGVLRGVRLDAPDTTAWSASLGGTSHSAPLRIGTTVFLLVDGVLVAVEI